MYCGADISPNSNGCCSEAKMLVAESREASRTDTADVPRIFATFLTCSTVRQMSTPTRCSMVMLSRLGLVSVNCLNPTRSYAKLVSKLYTTLTQHVHL